jgi:CheY-like chemotaxis protein
VESTVLVVDDSSFIVEGLATILNRHGYRPLTAFSGEDCLKTLEKEYPDIIILDILMEPMDGWETLQRIRRNPRTRRIPVLIFSAKKLSIEDAETYRISIDDFIAKPIVPKTLISAISRVLTRYAFDRQLVSFWRAAGVAEETIDAYLSVKSELDVDTQLQAVLQRQKDLCTADDPSCRDLEKALSAISERIREENNQIEEMAGRLPRVTETDTDEQREKQETVTSHGPVVLDPEMPETEPAAPAGNASSINHAVPAEGVDRGEPVPDSQELRSRASPGQPEYEVAFPGFHEEQAPAAESGKDAVINTPVQPLPVNGSDLNPVYYNENSDRAVGAVPVNADEKLSGARTVPAPGIRKADYLPDEDRLLFEEPAIRHSGPGPEMAKERAEPVPDAQAAPVQQESGSPPVKISFFHRLFSSILSLLRGLTLKR